MRWSRMLLHAAIGAAILRLVFPRAGPGTRRRLVGWWSAKVLRIAGVALRVEGTPPAHGESGAMIAANHVSWLDIFALSGVRPTRFIAKSEIRDWPLAGWIAERGGTIFIRREKRGDTGRISERVHQALEEGDCVGLFPEGATTEGDEMLKFHSSLFEPAVANAAHVHPCAIRYQRSDGTLCREMAYVGELSFMQSFGLVLRQHGVMVTLSFAVPIETANRTRREVASLAESQIASLLGLEKDRKPRTLADLLAAPR
ncbi:MAG: lysophospholipid acyltransferase family protein [Usitatibacter sp.]